MLKIFALALVLFVCVLVVVNILGNPVVKTKHWVVVGCFILAAVAWKAKLYLIAF